MREVRRTSSHFVLAVLAVVTLALLAGCGKPETGARQQEISSDPGEGTTVPPTLYGSKRYRFEFQDLETMVATSSLVVDGEVTQIDYDAILGESSELWRVTLDIETVLFGSPATTPVIFKQELRANGRPIIFDGVKPAQVGDRGVYFLRRIEGQSAYSLINDQGQYLVGRDGKLFGSNTEHALVRTLNQLSLDDVRTRVRDAGERVRRGEVRPAS